MFTGIITEIGKIEKIENIGQKRYYTISCSQIQSVGDRDISATLKIGESVACNGICLTVTHFTTTNIKVEVMHQTSKNTTASDWQPNRLIHLERAMRLSDRLNGHIVQGHIDTTVPLQRAFKENGTLYLELSLPAEYTHLVVPHGSICIDGVSLTIANLYKASFQVALIEHTLNQTHFSKLKTGEKVNIEFDIIGKYVVRLQSTAKNSAITEDWLAQNGF